MTKKVVLKPDQLRCNREEHAQEIEYPCQGYTVYPLALIIRIDLKDESANSLLRQLAKLRRTTD